MTLRSRVVARDDGAVLYALLRLPHFARNDGF